MKVEVTKAPAKFEPITLTITLETRDELLDMYARHNINNSVVAKCVGDFAEFGVAAQRVGKSALVAAVGNSPSDIKAHALLSLLQELL